MNSLQAIQLMISPVFMVSGCALLLSTSNNKYSSVMNRVRILSESTRSSKQKMQIRLLVKRLKFIRNATYSFQFAVGFFVLSSLLIGVSHFLKNNIVDNLVVISFSIGMTCVFCGIVFLAFESKKGYEIIKEYTKEYL